MFRIRRSEIFGRRGYRAFTRGVIKVGSRQTSDYLSANQRHLGFDKPPHAYLAGDDRLGISM